MKWLVAGVVACLLVASVICEGNGEALPPFTRSDRITVEGVLSRYPAIKDNLQPLKLASIVSEIPDGLKTSLKMSIFSYVGGRVHYDCYYENCQWSIHLYRLHSDHIKHFLESYGPASGMKDCYFVTIARDELVQLWFDYYLFDKMPQGTPYIREIKRLMQLVTDLPVIRMSIDLDNNIERTKFLIPDEFMLFGGEFGKWDSIKEETIQGSQKHPWVSKQSKVFWRGAASGESYQTTYSWADLPRYFPRMELVRQSMLYPQRIDAWLVSFHRKFQQAVVREKGFGERINKTFVSIEQHLKYRYLPSLDGWTAAWLRVPWILTSNSILLKQQSNKVEWFDYLLKPKVHYYPINNDISDLLEAVDNLQANQDQVQKIIESANNFSAQNFVMEKIREEALKVFREYSQAQNCSYSELDKELIIQFGVPYHNISNLTEEEKLEKVRPMRIKRFLIYSISITLAMYCVYCTHCCDIINRMQKCCCNRIRHCCGWLFARRNGWQVARHTQNLEVMGQQHHAASVDSATEDKLPPT